MSAAPGDRGPTASPGRSQQLVTTRGDLTPGPGEPGPAPAAAPPAGHLVGRNPPLAAWAGLVAVGGALGTLARAGLGTVWPTGAGEVPWTTLAINLAGSFLLGLLLQTLSLTGPDHGWRKVVRLGLGTGVMGGFTTYSTFVLESERLLTGSHALTGATYLLGSVVAGLVAAAAGLTVAQGLRAGRRGTGTAR